jgi:hypothetical protein
VLALAVVVPTDRTTLPPGVFWGVDTSRDGRYAQLVGTTQLYVTDRDVEPVAIDLWQLAGNVHVDLQEGATVRLELTTDDRDHVVIVEESSDGSTAHDVSQRTAQYVVRDGRLRLTAGEGNPDLVLRLWAGSGTSINISRWGTDGSPMLLDPAPDETWLIDGMGQVLVPTPAPTPTNDPGDASGEGATP